MKLITWNCNMAFRNKFDNIIKLKPDIICLQECENKSKLEDAIDSKLFNQIIWHGDNPHKGVAIINRSEYTLKIAEAYNPEFRYIIPIDVEGTNTKIFLIWAMPYKNSMVKSYVGQIWRAINYYTFDSKMNYLLVGDFNSHTQWDSMRKTGNHSHVVSFLKERKVTSLYHQFHNIDHGEESEATFYLHRNKNKPYHMDYCFASNALIKPDLKLKIGTFDDWITLSDHMPVIIDNIDLI